MNYNGPLLINISQLLTKVPLHWGGKIIVSWLKSLQGRSLRMKVKIRPKLALMRVLTRSLYISAGNCIVSRAKFQISKYFVGGKISISYQAIKWKILTSGKADLEDLTSFPALLEG